MVTLFSIALKNIKRNFYNYFIYFFSMVFSIMIYYVFTSIQYNEQVLKLVEIKEEIGGVFKASSIVVAVFAAIFIWYSNSFFTKRRKKEVGLYSLMGVRKRQIGRMLFYENIMMGVLALGLGVFMGSLLSKVFVMLLVKLMGFSVDIEFAIMPRAIINTLITFTILFLVTSIHGYTIIYRFKLIELFKADKKAEREPKTSLISAILGIALIGGGYILYLASRYYSLYTLLGTLVLVVVGTYFFFSSFTVFMIKLAKKNKKKYYQGINLIGTSQLLYRIKGHSRTLATIAVLSATTLTAMGVTASYYYDFQTKLDTRYPFTYVYISEDKNLNKDIEDIMEKYPQNRILNSAQIEFVKVKGILPQISQYKSDGEKTIHLISESKYNEIDEVRGLKKDITLNSSDEAVIIDEFYNEAFMETYTGKNVEINFNNKNTRLKIVETKEYPLLNEFMIFGSILVVKDTVYDKYYNDKNIIIGKAYMNDNKKESKELTEELSRLTSEAQLDSKGLGRQFTSYYTPYREGLISSGLTIFVGAFLGLVFLLSTGSIIFFKQLSEATDDKIRYKILKDIGLNKREIRKSIAKQMLFVFLLPLIIGIIHSLVAVSLLDKVLKANLAVPISLSVGAYTLIYMIYYGLTVNSYAKIVNTKS